jgi:hypothetical protein
MKRMALLGAPVAALLLPLAAVPAPASASPVAAPKAEASAKVWSSDGVLKNCAGHAFRYAVDVPAGDSWSLELHLENKQSRTVAFGFEVKGGDPAKGHDRFLFCSDDVRPGRYQVKAELIWSHYSDETHVWAQPRTIRLRRP